MNSTKVEELSREQMVKETIQAFVEIVLTEKFADMPNWMDRDLTVSQVRAIYLLAFHRSLAISVLAKKLDIGVPAASVLVQQLVEQGLVDRSEDSHDRRRSLVRLTRTGIALVSGRSDLKEAKFRRRMAQMSDDELAALLRGVQALAEIMRKEKAEQAGEQQESSE